MLFDGTALIAEIRERARAWDWDALHVNDERGPQYARECRRAAIVLEKLATDLEEQCRREANKDRRA